MFRRLLPIVRLPKVKVEGYSTSALPIKREKIINKLTKTKRGTFDNTHRDNILHLEIVEALAQHNLSVNEVEIPRKELEDYLFSRNRPDVTAQNVPIIYQTSEGDGLGLISNSDCKSKLIKVPKTFVGDIVSVKLRRHHQYYAEGSLIEVTKKSSMRTNTDLVVCDKFSECSGCQFQMIPYEQQLEFKSSIIERAFQFFYPSIDKDIITGVVDSPMQYSYRTKLTPHYQFSKQESAQTGKTSIGFNKGGKGGGIVDVDYCPIATPPLNQMLPRVRESVKERVAMKISNGEPVKGETLLLRESTRVDHATGEFDRVCLTNPKHVATEKVGDYTFQFPASEFFQVNNEILPEVLGYIRYHIEGSRVQYLVDAYCGSGLFSISLANDIPGKVFGIEISKSSIMYASHNAKLNGLNTDKIQYIEGEANGIFSNKEFLESGIFGSESLVIMDPSRKGSNESFMRQLLEFQPKVIVYVSCNVFTQARDLATFEKLQNENEGGVRYRVKEVTGFDFFPQTKHVESVAIIERID